MIKWNLKRLVHSCFTATDGFMIQSVQAGEKIGADQLRIHQYVFGILNRLKVNSSDGLQMRKGYVSLFSPLKLTDADLQSVCVRPRVKKKFSWKCHTQLLFTVWMARLTRHSIHSSMPRISITTKSAAEFARRPSFPITLINSFSIDQTVRKPIEQMRFIRMCPLACFEQDNVRWGSWTDYTDTNENHQNESSVKNKHEKNGHKFSIQLPLAGHHLNPRRYSTLTVRHLQASPESLSRNEQLPTTQRCGAIPDSYSQWEREASLKTHRSTQTGVWGRTLLGVREWQQM